MTSHSQKELLSHFQASGGGGGWGNHWRVSPCHTRVLFRVACETFAKSENRKSYYLCIILFFSPYKVYTVIGPIHNDMVGICLVSWKLYIVTIKSDFPFGFSLLPLLSWLYLMLLAHSTRTLEKNTSTQLRNEIIDKWSYTVRLMIQIWSDPYVSFAWSRSIQIWAISREHFFHNFI